MNKQTPLDAGGASPVFAVNRDADRSASPRLPIVRCPVCNSRAFTRTSEEVTPEFRRLYYRCSDFQCSMTFRASLIVEEVISPSGVSPHFRPAALKERRPPGHEYGQAPPPPPLLSYLDSLGPRQT